MSKTLLIASNLAIFTAYHERKGDVFYPAVHELRRLDAIERAAIALIKCKGRYHAEQNTNALAAALGVELPFVDITPPEPFGYFRNDGFDWHDCHDDDEGAIALYERP